MPKYDFDNNEYHLIRDVEQRAAIRQARGCSKEWRVISYDGNQVRLQSATHEDDVELVITGNFTKDQKWRLAEELCAQLNKAEHDAAKELADAQPNFRPTNFVDPDGADMLRKVLPPGLADEAVAVHEEPDEVRAEAVEDRQHNDSSATNG